MKRLIGPFTQILPLSALPPAGALSDDALRVVPRGGILTDGGFVLEVDDFEQLRARHPQAEIEEITGPAVLLPGFVDCHTHLCFAGDRAGDYAMRIAGKSYQEIAASGGGIWDSVRQTRGASPQELVRLLLQRIARHSAAGVTTIEIKSGYGLHTQAELTQLLAIKEASWQCKADLVATCLAAHILPQDFNGPRTEYLEMILNDLLPKIKKEKLASRVDIFIEQGAFDPPSATSYLRASKQMGFDLTVHADQFTAGGSEVAVKQEALSADHLEASKEKEIKRLAASKTVAVALPGASLGLGIGFAPARELLNAGACLAIASDWNPGSAPMGDLLLQASLLSAYEKLTTAETFAAITVRAAKALNLHDRGSLEKGKLADMQSYACNNYREILYHQGTMKANVVYKNGEKIA